MTRTSMFLAFAALLAVAALLPDSAPTPAATPAQLPAQTSTVEGVRLQAKLGQGAVARSHPSEVLARLELQAAREVAARPRGQVSLALVFDRSSSMAGQKLEDARMAALELISTLEDGDHLALIDYGTDVRTFASTRIDEEGRAALSARVRSLAASGATNISDALRAGAEALRRCGSDFTSRRIILLSDGQPTVGEVNPELLAALAAGLREQGLAVSALGVGTDFNDRLMRELATRGGGFYAFLPDAADLRPILAQELSQAVNAVARQVELRLLPGNGVTVKEVHSFPWRRLGDGSVAVQFYDLSAGGNAQLLVELDVAPGAERQLLASELSFRTPASAERVTTSAQLTAERTDDRRVLAEHVDEAVQADALRARGGRQIAEATLEYERGNHARARSLFDGVRALFGTRAQALSGDLSRLEKAERELYSAPAHAVSGQGMQMRKNLTNFGVNNYY